MFWLNLQFSTILITIMLCFKFPSQHIVEWIKFSATFIDFSRIWSIKSLNSKLTWKLCPNDNITKIQKTRLTKLLSLIFWVSLQWFMVVDDWKYFETYKFVFHTLLSCRSIKKQFFFSENNRNKIIDTIRDDLSESFKIESENVNYDVGGGIPSVTRSTL